MSAENEEVHMDADFEGRIRSRIESILINDARKCTEMQSMASEDEPFELGTLDDERNLYQRIINSYRAATHEVNHMLEENVGLISGMCRIVESIKGSEEFPEICSHMVDCILQDFGAEYCAFAFQPQEAWDGNPLFVEGIREQHQLLFCHSHPTLLGSYEFARAVEPLGDESERFVNFGDVYREPRFYSVDFPSVVRSMICVSIGMPGKRTGVLVLSHSLPHFFTPNHGRVLRILASMTSHIQRLTIRRITRNADPGPAVDDSNTLGSDTLAVILLHFSGNDSCVISAADRSLASSLIRPLSRVLVGRESILPYDTNGLLVLSPGTDKDGLLGRISRLRAAFEEWRDARGESGKSLRMTFGHATCENGEQLTHAMEMARQIIENL
jgi:hypothetical protein